jgi:hypothetical protein
MEAGSALAGGGASIRGTNDVTEGRGGGAGRPRATQEALWDGSRTRWR